jgi:hypothetical protein
MQGRVRLEAWITFTVLLLAVLYPYFGGYYPEGSWYRGPLWATRSQSIFDCFIGWGLSLVLAPAITFPWVKRTWITIAIGILGTIAWLGFGLFLTYLAAV